MSTAQIWQTVSTSSDTTLELAGTVGHKLRGGETIELVSDLGGGKTTFVRGLVRGAGSHDHVRSPSFTLSNQYRTDKLTIYHFDFYRLVEPGIMRDEIAETLTDPEAVVVIEWANMIEDLLPSKRLTIILRATGEAARELTFKYPDELQYLIPSNT